MAFVLSDVILQTSSGNLAGWKSIEIHQSIEQMSNSFSFQCSEAGIAALAAHPVQLDTACRVLIGDTPVLNGYVENQNPQISPNQHDINISGRDITCDLIDSSALMPNQEMHNVTIREAAEVLCAPHKVKVECPEPGEPFEIYAVNDGESVFDSIEQHARQRKLLCYTYGDGILHIKKAKPIVIDYTLEEGVNFTNGSATHTNNDQYGEYRVKSQRHKGETNIKAVTKGTHKRLNRVLIVRPEKQDNTKESEDRGDWESRTRRAKGKRASITVPGWEFIKGRVWRPLMLPMLISPRLEFNETMLVASVKLHVDDNGGTLSTLELVKPELYA